MTPTRFPSSSTTGPPWYLLIKLCTFTSVNFKLSHNVSRSFVMNSSTRLYGHEIAASSLMSGSSAFDADIDRPPSRWSLPISFSPPSNVVSLSEEEEKTLTARCPRDWKRRRTNFWTSRERNEADGIVRMENILRVAVIDVTTWRA